MTASTAFFILALICMVAVVGAFLAGMFSMTRGAAGDSVRSNRMMNLRVILQAGAILFLFLAVVSK